MSAVLAGPRTETLGVVVIGSVDGDGELRAGLAAEGSGVDVKAWVPAVEDAVGLLGTDAVHGIVLAATLDGPSLPGSLSADVSLLRLHTDAPVILLVPATHPDLVTRALAAGVDDVLVLPQAPETIAFAVHKARRGPARSSLGGAADVPAERGRVVTVFSPKGGTGKTVLSTNIAAVLAQRSGKRVLLIDLDLQFGDAAIMLGLDPERTLEDLVRAPGALDSGKLTSYTTRHRSGLDVLAAPLRPEDAELVTESKILQVLEVARAAYDVVVVDTSPFFYGPMLAVLRQTDEVLMLCGLDVPTLKNVKLSLRTLEMLGFPAARTRIVLNRVTPKVGLTAADVADVLKVDVAFEIPNDPVVPPAVNSGAVAALSRGESEFAAALTVLVEALDPAGAPTVAPVVQASRRRWPAARRILEGRVG